MARSGGRDGTSSSSMPGAGSPSEGTDKPAQPRKSKSSSAGKKAVVTRDSFEESSCDTGGGNSASCQSLVRPDVENHLNFSGGGTTTSISANEGAEPLRSAGTGVKFSTSDQHPGGNPGVNPGVNPGAVSEGQRQRSPNRKAMKKSRSTPTGIGTPNATTTPAAPGTRAPSPPGRPTIVTGKGGKQIRRRQQRHNSQQQLMSPTNTTAADGQQSHSSPPVSSIEHSNSFENDGNNKDSPAEPVKGEETKSKKNKSPARRQRSSAEKSSKRPGSPRRSADIVEAENKALPVIAPENGEADESKSRQDENGRQLSPMSEGSVPTDRVERKKGRENVSADPVSPPTPTITTTSVRADTADTKPTRSRSSGALSDLEDKRITTAPPIVLDDSAVSSDEQQNSPTDHPSSTPSPSPSSSSSSPSSSPPKSSTSEPERRRGSKHDRRRDKRGNIVKSRSSSTKDTSSHRQERRRLTDEFRDLYELLEREQHQLNSELQTSFSDLSGDAAASDDSSGGISPGLPELEEKNSWVVPAHRRLWSLPTWVQYLTCLGEALTQQDVMISCRYFQLVAQSLLSQREAEDGASGAGSILKMKRSESLPESSSADSPTSASGRTSVTDDGSPPLETPLSDEEKLNEALRAAETALQSRPLRLLVHLLSYYSDAAAEEESKSTRGSGSSSTLSVLANQGIPILEPFSDETVGEMTKAVSTTGLYATALATYSRCRAAHLSGVAFSSESANSTVEDATAIFFRACAVPEKGAILPPSFSSGETTANVDGVRIGSLGGSENRLPAPSPADSSTKKKVAEDKPATSAVGRLDPQGVSGSVAMQMSTFMRKLSRADNRKVATPAASSSSTPKPASGGGTSSSASKRNSIGASQASSSSGPAVSFTAGASVRKPSDVEVNRSNMMKRSMSLGANSIGTNSTASSTVMDDDESATSSPGRSSTSLGENYTIFLHKEMLGLTVENVLERTIIRTVLPHGAAKKSGARVGSLIVQVGSVETRNLTHFETIDELRQSNRPLKLVLRRIPNDDLVKAREEMGRLIRGGGFSNAAANAVVATSAAAGSPPTSPTSAEVGGEKGLASEDKQQAPSSPSATVVDGAKPAGISVSLEKVIHARWSSALTTMRPSSPLPGGPSGKISPAATISKRMSKRDKQLAKMSERMVYILSLFVVGLDFELASAIADDNEAMAASEASKSGVMDTKTDIVKSPRGGQRRRNIGDQKRQKASYYAEAARSVSRIVLDFLSRHIDAMTTEGRTIERCKLGGGTGSGHGVISPVSRQPQHRGGTVTNMQKVSFPTHRSASLLWQIGDVLHRARSFLGDLQTLAPSTVLQTHLIGFLCDVLDFDTEMELSEFDEEDHSSQRGTGGKKKSKSGKGGAGRGGTQDELGAAGSLLKLVVRNCCTFSEKDSLGGLSSSTKQAPKERPTLERSTGKSTEKDRLLRLGNTSTAGNRFLAVVHRLAASRSTIARITACSLGPVLWGHLDFPHQLQLRGVITRALHDVEVIVRKSTAAVLHEIAELVFDPRSVPWLVLMCERAMTDPEPQLRAAAMTLTWHLAEHLPNAFLGDARQGSRSLSRLPARTDPTFAEVYLLQCKLLPVATRLGEDRHPQVRLAVAAQCDRLCVALGDHWCAVVIDLLQALLGDSSEQVRSEATLCLPRLVDSVLASGDAGKSGGGDGTSVLESLLPHAIKLIKDSATCVRVALATSCGELLTLLVGLGSYDGITGGSTDGQDDLKEHMRHIDQTLIPLVQRLLHDPDPEVTSAALRAVTNASRGNVKEISNRSRIHQDPSPLSPRRDESIKNIANSPLKEPVFIPVLSEAQVLRLLPTLSDLAASSQWRVRQSAVEIVPALLGCTQRLATRTEIAQLCVTLMGDTVDAVRKTAAECLCLGGGSLGGDGGGEWIRAIVIPNLTACRDSSSSKQRMLCLKMVEVLVRNRVCHSSPSSLSTASPLRVILDVAASLSEDKVVNVRLNVGRVLMDVVEDLCDENDISFVAKVMEEQVAAEASRAGGGDRDVLYFAKGALARAHNCLTRCSGGDMGTPPRTPDRKKIGHQRGFF